MDKIKDVKVKFSLTFNYTDTVNQMIEDEEVESIDQIRDILLDWIFEDVESALTDDISDNIKISIK